MKKSITVEFPLYKNDGKISEKIIASELQKKTIGLLVQKLKNNEYKTVETNCICGQNNTVTDLLITEKDRYGIPYELRLCSTCGLIYPTRYLDSNSLGNFYKNDYRKIYTWGESSEEENIEKLYQAQREQGNRMLQIMKEEKLINENYSHVLEIGSACGGNLEAFKTFGLSVLGCDFDKDYLEYGKQRGLDLRYGDLKDLSLGDNSQDIIILYHVLEHLVNPINEIELLISKLKTGGLLIIGIPSIFSIDSIYKDPLKYFQNAHVYSFTGNHIISILKAFGLGVRYSNEEAIVIAEKLEGSSKKENFIASYLSELKAIGNIVIDYLATEYLRWELSKDVLFRAESYKTNLNSIRETLEKTRGDKALLHERNRTLIKENLRIKSDLAKIYKNRWYIVSKRHGVKKLLYIIKTAIKDVLHSVQH